MVATRIHHGLALPAIPATQAQSVLELEPEACLPRGYRLEPGLRLVRTADGEFMGVMASVDFACRHASMLVRMESLRAAQQEVTG